MLISVVNRSKTLADTDLQKAVRAINRQLEEDFYPHWQFGARLRLDSAGRVPTQRDRKIDLPTLPGRRGDAVIYIVDKPTMAATEGYHDDNNADVPFGFVFLNACGDGADDWTVALSHEAIELVGTDLAHAIPLTLIAGMGHLALGNVDLVLMLNLLAGSIPGVLAGSWISTRAPVGPLRTAIAVVLLFVAWKMVAG